MTPDEIERARLEYHPCDHGLHVCGETADGERPLTIANVEWIDQRTFAALEAEFSSGADGDLVVDLIEFGDTIDDFWIRRQSLDALLARARSI